MEENVQIHKNRLEGEIKKLRYKLQRARQDVNLQGSKMQLLESYLDQSTVPGPDFVRWCNQNRVSHYFRNEGLTKGMTNNPNAFLEFVLILDDRYDDACDLYDNIDELISDREEKLESIIVRYAEDMYASGFLGIFRNKEERAQAKKDRQARRGARKDKRTKKKIAKKEWKDSGKTGGRKAWKDIKKGIKQEKRDIIQKHGGTFAGKFAKGVAKVVLSGPRNAFLGLVRINGLGFAGRMNAARNERPDAWEKVKRIYKAMGGSTSSLKKAVDAGHGKPAIMAKNSKWQNVTGAEVVAWVGAASPIIVPVLSALSGDGQDPQMSDEFYTKALDDVWNNQQLGDQDKEFIQDVMSAGDAPSTGISTLGWIGIGVGTAAVIGTVIYFATKKKGK